MKRFDFPLERVRKWRESLAEIEEAKLAGLHAELRAIEARQAEVAGELAAAEQIVRTNAVARAEELAALDGYREWVRGTQVVLAQRAAGSRDRIAQQQQALVEARRRFRLLDLLKTRSQEQWKTEFARELESLASEVYLAQWRRR